MGYWTAKEITDQSGKTALITGANCGIGYYTALELARAGAHTILGCRNLLKAEEAKNKILKEVPGAKIEIAQFDLADLNSVKAYSEKFISEGKVLDILVCNAGVMTPQKRVMTKDGYELQWGTNYLGHFALTGSLLPAISKSPKGRIVIVSSVAHRGGKIFFEDLNAEKAYHPMNYYKQSKLADTIFGIELEKRLRQHNSNVICVEAHPGISRTELLPNSHEIKKTFVSWFMKVATRLGMHPAQGALSSLYAATSPDAQGGKFYGPHSMSGTRGYPIEQAFDNAVNIGPDKVDQLWKLSEKQTGVRFLS